MRPSDAFECVCGGGGGGGVYHTINIYTFGAVLPHPSFSTLAYICRGITDTSPSIFAGFPQASNSCKLKFLQELPWIKRQLNSYGALAFIRGFPFLRMADVINIINTSSIRPNAHGGIFVLGFIIVTCYTLRQGNVHSLMIGQHTSNDWVQHMITFILTKCIINWTWLVYVSHCQILVSSTWCNNLKIRRKMICIVKTLYTTHIFWNKSRYIKRKLYLAGDLWVWEVCNFGFAYVEEYDSIKLFEVYMHFPLLPDIKCVWIHSCVTGIIRIIAWRQVHSVSYLANPVI